MFCLLFDIVVFMECFFVKFGFGFLWLLFFLLYGFVVCFGEGLGGLLYCIFNGCCCVVLVNLCVCFFEKFDVECEVMVYDVFCKVFCSFVECLFVWFVLEKCLMCVVKIDD